MSPYLIHQRQNLLVLMRNWLLPLGCRAAEAGARHRCFPPRYRRRPASWVSSELAIIAQGELLRTHTYGCTHHPYVDRRSSSSMTTQFLARSSLANDRRTEAVVIPELSPVSSTSASSLHDPVGGSMVKLELQKFSPELA
ncbi:hypothetical protein ACQJBY_054922 [Aegilops geniculata]